MRGGLILVLLVLLLLVSSCQQNQEATNLGGVDIEFLENQPPTTLREGAQFNVGLNLKNNLPEAVDNIEICISDSLTDGYGGIYGKECQYVSISPAEHGGEVISPEEVRTLFPQGGGGYYYNNLELGPDNTIILVDMAYSLHTSSRIDICLKQDPSFEVDEVECEANTVFSGGDIRSDFAPVTVERVDSSVVSEGFQNKIYADIYLRKDPFGEVVYSQDHTQNLMGISVSLGSGDVFTCDVDQNGFFKFDDITEMISCDAPVVLDDSWQMDALNIDLFYDYSIGLTLGPLPIKKMEEGLN